LLRREGLCTSHLTYWRKQRDDGALKELGKLGKPRGRKPVDTRDAQITALTRRTERAEAELQRMRRLVGTARLPIRGRSRNEWQKRSTTRRCTTCA
jgi:transposase